MGKNGIKLISQHEIAMILTQSPQKESKKTQFFSCELQQKRNSLPRQNVLKMKTIYILIKICVFYTFSRLLQEIKKKYPPPKNIIMTYIICGENVAPKITTDNITLKTRRNEFKS